MTTGVGFSGFVEALIAAFSVLGGSIAIASGYLAAEAYWSLAPPERVAEKVNDGIALGFTIGTPLALGALIIEFGT